MARRRRGRGGRTKGGVSLYRNFRRGNSRRLSNLNSSIRKLGRLGFGGGAGGIQSGNFGTSSKISGLRRLSPGEVAPFGGGGDGNQAQANAEMAAAQRAALGVPERLRRDYESNPYLAQLRQGIAQWASAPGLDAATVGRLQGAARARFAADSVAGQRNLAAGAAARGISGARLSSLQNANRMRASVGANRQLNDIAVNAELSRIQDRGNALGSLSNLVNSQTAFQTQLGQMLMNQYNQWQPQAANLAPYQQQLGRAQGFLKRAKRFTPPTLPPAVPEIRPSLNTLNQPPKNNVPFGGLTTRSRFAHTPISRPTFTPNTNMSTMFGLGLPPKRKIPQSALDTVYGF